MAIIQRPLKEGSVRTYQEKVGLGFPDILASEMDADLATIFDAWNGGVDTVNIKDGAVTAVKLGTDAYLWTVSGATLTPTDTARTLSVLTTTVPQLTLGGSTQKAKVEISTTGILSLSMNDPYAPQDTTKGSWAMQLESIVDAFHLYHRAAGAAAGGTELLKVDGTGNLTAIGQTHTFGVNSGTCTAKVGPRGQMYADANLAEFYANGPASLAYDRNGLASWMLRLNPGGGVDRSFFFRRTPGTDNFVSMLEVDSAGNLVIAGGVAIKATGTTWQNPSDRRLKDEIEDYPAGLAAILQLQPRTFIYNGKGGSPVGMRGYGFIADEIAPVMPETVGTRAGKLDTEDEDETDIQTLDQSNLILALVNAVQELAARVTALEARGT